MSLRSLTCALALGACGGTDGFGFDGPTSLAILPDDFATAVDRHTPTVAALRNDLGDYFVLDAVTFKFDASKIEIDNTGIALPLVPGDVTFEAEAEGFTGKATFHVMDERPVKRETRTMVIGAFEVCFIGTDNATYCAESSPTFQQRSQEPFTTLTASDYTTCGLRSDGVAMCGLEPRLFITTVPGTGYVAIASGRDTQSGYVCGVTADGLLGCDSTGRSPFSRIAPFAKITGIGPNSKCVISGGWQMYCGESFNNDFEDIGSQGTDGRSDRVVGNQFWDSVVTGDRYSCGVTLAGVAYCWGMDNLGQLGTTASKEICAGSTDCIPRPARVAGDHKWRSLAAGTAITCGLDVDGKAWCWGGGTSLGDGTVSTSPIPVAVTGGHVFTQISVGNRMSCGTTAAGELWCWGLLPGANPGTPGPGNVVVPDPVLLATPVPVKSPL